MKRTAAVLLAGVLLLTGCAAESSASATPSLADTKRSAQLVRNTIAGQISPDITANISEVTDKSETCQSDPKGIMRLWRSTSLTELTPEAASKVTLIQQTIEGTYVSKGWTSETKPVSGQSTKVTLTNPSSLAVIEITATTDVDSVGTGATLLVNIAGPCVKTDGPGSDELKKIGETLAPR
jgi:hypothetical protein